MAPGWISPPEPGARASVTDSVATSAYQPHLPEATTPVPDSSKPDPALVRRKPLPPTASPVIPPHPRRSGPSTSSSSSLYSNRSLSQADPPPLRSSVSLPHSRGSSLANSLSSPPSNSAVPSSAARGDPSLFSRRTLDRYVKICPALLSLSTPCHHNFVPSPLFFFLPSCSFEPPFSLIVLSWSLYVCPFRTVQD